MRLVSWIWFWYVLTGFVMGGGLTCFIHWAKKNAIKVKAFEWILIVLIELGIMFMMQTFIASFEELVPRAAWLTIVFMGLPIIIMVVILARSIAKRLS